MRQRRHKKLWAQLREFQETNLTRMQIIDVHLPTTCGRTILLQRHIEPDKETALLLPKLRIKLPQQPRPKVLPNGTVKL